MTTQNKGPFCPNCASVMQITGQTEMSRSLTYHCSSCGYDSHPGGSGITPIWLGAAITTPPGDQQRCSRCGAFAFTGWFNDPPTCHRCGAPNPNERSQVGSARISQSNSQGFQPDSPAPALSSQLPQYVQPQQPQPGYPALSFAPPPIEKTGPGCWGVGLGVVTILGALVLLFFVILLSFGTDLLNDALGLGLLCFWFLQSLLGIVVGILAIFSKRRIGKILCGIFWLLIPVFILAVLIVGSTF